MIRALLCCIVLATCTAPIFAQATAPADTSACTDLKTRAERAEARLNDWPALARYRDDNAKVTPPAKNEQRVVFMNFVAQ